MNRSTAPRKIDFLQYQIKEIEDSHLVIGEGRGIKALRERIRNAGQYLQGSHQMLLSVRLGTRSQCL
jgi:DNA repair ATPase RecN